MQYEDLQYLSVQLPEDILKEKWSGHYQKAEALIKERLKDEKLPYALRCRLELERNNMALIKTYYTKTKEEALAEMREEIPDFTEEEFDRLQLEGKIDYMYLEDEVRYGIRSCKTLFCVYPEIWERSIKDEEDEENPVKEFLPDLSDGKEMVCHIHIRHTMELTPAGTQEGETLRVHIPFPCERDGITNLNTIEISPAPAKLPLPAEAQPTVYFEGPVKAGQKYEVEYEFDHVQTYVDTARIDLKKVEEGAMPAGAEAYLKEELPHIQFTPYIRALAEEIRGDETNPLLIARKFYDYITTKVDYRFVRPYGSIDNLSEYCAVNRRGDCGIQALLFITLCRLSGIPAGWESGINARPHSVGMHDWAVFYIPSVGRLHADPSCGGGAYAEGNTALWNFYFGNVDPYRIPLNNEFQRQFVPEKKYLRLDPYDNQCGEAEYESRGLGPADFICDYEDKGIYRIK